MDVLRLAYMIDLRRLQVLRVLGEEGSIAGTARLLHVTPSAVSQQVRLLSHDLGVELLQRKGRGVRLTAAAESLIRHVDTLYAQWEEALTELAGAGEAGQLGQLRLCGFPTAVASLLAPAAARLHVSHPGINVQIVEAETPDCYARLVAEQADLAVVVPTASSPTTDDARLDQRPLLDDPFDLLVPRQHRLAARDTVDLADAAHDSWIAAPESLDQHQLMSAAWTAAGFTPRIAHQAKEWNAIVALVSHGFGVCLIPRLAPLPAHQAVVRLPLRGEPAPSRRVLTVVRRGSRGRAAVAATCAALDEVALQLPPQLLEHTGDHHDDATTTAHPHRHRR
jgi:DNA-binding transcriptional LysR family regulator